MKQNSYNQHELEIVGKLDPRNMHLRELSRELNTNPMTIKRVTDALYEKGIIDFEQRGKNKVFFLRKNIESRGLILSYEIKKQAECVQKYPLLRNIFEKISLNKKIKLAILFGSYAKGISGKNSDIDIYVETQDVKLKEEIEKINSKISVKIGKFNKDLLLIKEIINHHVIIKGFEEYYEKEN